MRHVLRALSIAALLLWTARAFGIATREARTIPSVSQAIDIEEHLGRPIDQGLSFTRSDGARMRLADAFSDGRPVVLILAYYRCPMLCGLVLRGMAQGLKDLSFTLGEHYRVLTVSIDPRDNAEAARHKQLSTLSWLGRADAGEAWEFLVGQEPAIKALADDLGFRYAHDPRTDQYAHPAVAFVLTPDGRISRYLYGAQFSPRDLRLALMEASQGRIGSIVDRVLLSCYRYDPASRRYGPYVLGFVRLGGALILLVVTGLLAILWRGERRRRLSQADLHGDKAR